MMKHIDSTYDPTTLQDSLDQTILVIFRAFAGLRFAIALLLLTVQHRVVDGISFERALTVVDALFLLVYLSLPVFRQLLGRFHLIVGLAYASIMPILVQGFAIWIEFQNIDSEVVFGARLLDLETILSETVVDWVLLAIVGQMLIALMTPLIIISWRYMLRHMVIFCVLTAVLDAITTFVAMPLGGSQIVLLIGLVIARTFLFLLIGGIVNRLVTVQKQQQQDLLWANQQLRQYATTREKLAVSQERNRLARELHDTLAHTLSATAIQLEAIGVILDKQPEKARDLLAQATTRTRDGLDETRRALDALRAAPVENMGLRKSVELLVEATKSRYGLEVDSRFSEGSFPINPEQEHSIYRIIQEAVNNAARHASAKSITIQADYLAPFATFSISDDGVGFDATQLMKNGHYGLRGMQERAHQINAQLEIDSQPNIGTTIILSVET